MLYNTIGGNHWQLIGIRASEDEEKQSPISVRSRFSELPAIIRHAIRRPPLHTPATVILDITIGGYMAWRAEKTSVQPVSVSDPLWDWGEMRRVFQISGSFQRNLERYLVGNFTGTESSPALIRVIAAIFVAEQGQTDENDYKTTNAIRTELRRFLEDKKITAEDREILRTDFALTDRVMVKYRIDRYVSFLREQAATDLPTVPTRDELGPFQSREAMVTSMKNPESKEFPDASEALARHYVNGLEGNGAPSVQKISILLLENSIQGGGGGGGADRPSIRWIRPRDYEKIPLASCRYIVLMRTNPGQRWFVLGNARYVPEREPRIRTKYEAEIARVDSGWASAKETVKRLQTEARRLQKQEDKAEHKLENAVRELRTLAKQIDTQDIKETREWKIQKDAASKYKKITAKVQDVMRQLADAQAQEDLLDPDEATKSRISRLKELENIDLKKSKDGILPSAIMGFREMPLWLLHQLYTVEQLHNAG